MADLGGKKNITIIEEANEQLDLFRENLEVVYKELVSIKKDSSNDEKNVLDILDFSSIIEKLDFSQLIEDLGIKVMKKVRKSALKKSLKGYSIKTIISTLIKSIGGNQAAKNALSLMFKPMSSYAPLFMLPEFVDYYLNLARESADLTEKIGELGEEEGRIAAGNGMWDKAAIYQYDMQKVDSDILYKRLFSNKDKEEVEEKVDFSNWLSQIKLDADILMETIEPLLSLETWQELGNNIKTGLTTMWDEFVEWWRTTGLYIWWTEEIVPFFSLETWQELGNNIKTGLTTMWDEFVEWWRTTGLYIWWTEEIAPFFSLETWQEFGRNMKTGLSTMWDEFVEWWKTTGLYKWWTENVAPFFEEEKWTFDGIKKGLSKAWNLAVEEVKKIWNQFANWLNDVLKIKFDGVTLPSGEEIAAFEIQLGTIPVFEVGGFPEDGLFMANHSELVGQFSNGKTAVANNEQIVSGIKLGVREAVSEVLAPYLADIAQNTRETANKDFTTYIGDKEIARASERGRMAMGLQLITEF